MYGVLLALRVYLKTTSHARPWDKGIEKWYNERKESSFLLAAKKPRAIKSANDSISSVGI